MITSAARVTVGRFGELGENPPWVEDPDVGESLSREDTKRDEELAARRAVAGVDLEIIRAGGSAEEADAVSIALRRFLLGDEDGARRALAEAFPNGMAKKIMAKFNASARAA
jgi:hypothetical protein